MKELLAAKQSILNISSTNVVSIVSVLSSILLTPYILHRIGVDEYAVWIVLNALLGYFNFSKLGFTTKMLKDLSEQNTDNKIKIINSIFFAILFIQLLLSPLILVSYFWLKIFIKFNGNGYLLLVVGSFYLLYLSFFLNLLAGTFITIFQSRNKHYFANKIAVFKLLLNLLFVILIGTFAKLNIFIISAITFVLSFLYTAVLYVKARQVMPFSIHYKFFDKQYLKASLVPSLQYFMISIGAIAIYQSDAIVISAFLGTSAVTAYALGYRIVEIPQRFLWSVSNVLFPKISYFYANKHWSDLSLLMRKIFLVVIPSNVLISVLLYFFGIDLLTLWVGAEYVLAKSIFNLFIITWFVQTIAHTYGVIVNAVGKQDKIAGMVVLEAVLNLAISIYLVPRIGLIGAAIGTMISHFCVLGWFAMYCVHHELKIRF